MAMVDQKLLLGLLSLVIGIVSYAFYFRDVFRGKTKPDGASWFIWGLLAGITFFAQFSSGGGAGAWITAFTAVVCVTIAGIAFYRGHGKVKEIDLISLFLALGGVGLWLYTNNPLLAVVIVIVVGAIGFIPTFIKAFHEPHEETGVTFAMNASKFAVAFFALGSLHPVTWLYPAAMVIMNASLAAMIFLRQR